MKFSKLINIPKCFIVSALITSSTAQAMVVFQLGDDELSPGEGQGVSTITLTGLGDATTTAANNTDAASGLSMNATIASGTFTTTAAGGSAGVTFDITFTAFSGNLNSQGTALGVNFAGGTGGTAGAAIDNNFMDDGMGNITTGPQESITVSITNIMGLAVGETLAFTEIDTAFGSTAGLAETFVFNGGSDRLFTNTGAAGGSPPISGGGILDLSATPLQSFTIGAGSTGNTVFGIDDFTVSVVDASTVVPEPSSTLLLGLAGFGFVVRRRR